MVKDILTSRPALDTREVDEAWWDSLLMEEERWFPQDMPAQSDMNGTLSDQHVDWEKVQQAYMVDDVVEAEAYGYNQGGILVRNSVLQGFVPLSHLVATTDAMMRGELPPNWDAIQDPEVVQPILSAYVGRRLRLKIIECEPERGRIVLSERSAQCEPGRRTRLLNSLQPGQIISGQVTNITRFGVFIDLGGLEGLIHISELSWGRVQHPSDVVQMGEELKVHVIRVDRENNRVALSLKRMRPNPWEDVEQRYQVGQIISVQITCVVSFGAFARVEEGLDGLIHVSEMPHNGGAPKPWKIVHEGEIVQARIVHIDAARQRMGLSLLLD
ncbi:MAG: 30S ribosomal protein S1 [Anaerolineae bacterium]|nr:MAG: 30S ribosomal protein S1 [Anaerolineae bacterium]